MGKTLRAAVRRVRGWLFALTGQRRPLAPSRKGVALLAFPALLIGLALSLTAAATNGLNYVYDDSGRLIQVVSPDGSSIVYTYDRAGNPVSVQSISANPLVFSSFAPSSGPKGGVVTLSGSGFIPVPDSNTVTFNGIAANVLTATANTLTVAVPAKATSGLIVVSNSNGSATSTTKFTVTNKGAPTITSFTPTFGLTGTTVTVNGTTFQSGTGSQVTFGGIAAATTTIASAEKLTATVSSNAQSGPIAVTTKYGTATSIDNFYVIPAGINPKLVSMTAPIAVDGAAGSANFTAANTSAIFLFNGSVGQNLSLGIAGKKFIPNDGAGYLTVNIYGPGNNLFATCNGSINCNIPTLSQKGAYLIAMSIDGRHYGSASLWLSSNVTGVLVPDVAATTLALTRPGQNGHYAFTATAGQSLTLIYGGATFAGTSWIWINNPDGTLLLQSGFSDVSSSGVIALANLPQSGTYSVLVQPISASTGQMTLQLSSEARGSVVIDGAPLAINQIPGQIGHYTFSGQAGQKLGIGAINVPDGNVTVLAPDQYTVLTTYDSRNSGSDTFGGSIPPLPSNGIYTIVVTPRATAINGSLELSTELTGTLTPDTGVATIMMAQRPGQTSRYTFNATAGQSLALLYGGSTLQGQNNLSILNPNGTFRTNVNFTVPGDPVYFFYPSSGVIELSNLAQSGTYTVFITPANAGTGQMTLQLISDVTSPLIVDGASLQINQLPGQNGRYTFNGNAGQTLGLGVTNISTDKYGIAVIAPDLSVLTTCAGYGNPTFGCVIPALPMNGTYSILVTPDGTVQYDGNLYRSGDLAAITATLTLSSDMSGTLIPNGDSVTFATARAGQNGRYTFSAAAGQNFTLNWNNVTIPGAWTYLSIYNPDGSFFTVRPLSDPATYSDASSGSQTVSNTQSGTYTVFIQPVNAGVGQVQLNLTSP